MARTKQTLRKSTAEGQRRRTPRKTIAPKLSLSPFQKLVPTQSNTSTLRADTPLEEDYPPPLADRRPEPLKVTVDTGANCTTFVLIRSVICAHSELLARQSEASPSEEIVLPNIRTLDFDAYTLYYQPLECSIQTLVDNQWDKMLSQGMKLDGTRAQRIHMQVATLLGLWVTGDMLEDVKFKNDVMKALLEHDLADEAGAALVASAGCIIESCGIDSSLCRLLLDTLAPMVTEQFVSEGAEQWPKQFTVELLKHMVRFRGKQLKGYVPTVVDIELYYEAEEDQTGDA